MKQKNRILFFLVILFFVGCNKEEILTIGQKRANDANYNSSVTAGVKNVLFEKEFIANSESQLVLKMAYNNDTLAAYGKMDNTGKLKYIHSTVLMKGGGKSSFVSEIFPEISTTRMYSIIDNQKSPLIIEINYVSKTRYTISLLDVNWSTGEEKVVMTTMISDGIKTAEHSTLRTATEDRVWNCDEPQPADDLDGTVDNHLDYHMCGGLAWDTYPTLEAIKEVITSYARKIEDSEQYADKTAQLNFLENAYKDLSSLYQAIKGKVGSYKFEKSILGGLLKELEQSIGKLKENQFTISLEPFEPATDTEYDEVEDNEVKVTFLVTDVDTGLPFIKKPVFVDLAFVVPGTNTALDIQTQATSEVNGMVTFKFDPTMIEGYEKYSALEARWDLSSHNWQKSRSRTVTLKFIKPKVVFKNGNSLPIPIPYTNQQTQYFKLVNEDDRVINPDYTQVTINNVTNSKIGYTVLKGVDDFSIKLYTNESSLQYTDLDVYYNSKKVQTIKATIMDSLEIYRASAIGKYKVNNFTGNGPNSELYCELKEGGTARYTIYNDPSWPDGYGWNVS